MLHEAEHRSVLVVDDDAYVRRQLLQYMGEADFYCDTCSHPDDALVRIVNAPDTYSLVFMDIRFGDCPLGIEGARNIKSIHTRHKPRIVGITGISQFLQDKEILSYGFSEIIAKPIHKWLIINTAKKYCITDYQSDQMKPN